MSYCLYYMIDFVCVLYSGPAVRHSMKYSLLETSPQEKEDQSDVKHVHISSPRYSTTF